MARHTTITLQNCKLMKYWTQKFRGIMFKKRFQPHFFKLDKYQTRFHQYFCQPFDIIGLDKWNRVVLLKHSYEYDGLFLIRKIHYMIECQEGTIKNKKVKIGDTIKITYEKL